MNGNLLGLHLNSGRTSSKVLTSHSAGVLSKPWREGGCAGRHIHVGGFLASVWGSWVGPEPLAGTLCAQTTLDILRGQ